MQKQVQNLKNEALAQIMEAGSAGELEELRITYLGRNGKLTKLMKKMKELEGSKKKQVGMIINETKNVIVNVLSSQKNQLKDSARSWFDPTIPGKKPAIGSLHLITQAIEEITDIFKSIGFVRVRYPETEWDWYAFESLNMPTDHPARDEWETFFVESSSHQKYGQIVLTPHTSSGQIREMERVKTPPVRMINIAKCYRRQSDPSHNPMFHQFEGLVIDKNISITHLKGTIDYFARNYFGIERKIRLRPYHFQFTEPSFEVDIDCDICGGVGCKVCNEGWVELAGAGMVHPKVLKNGGIDPTKFSGFAFGAGLERVLMMKSGLKIPDLRILYSSNLDYLKQF